MLLCGRVSNKKDFTRPISGNKTNFFWPNVLKEHDNMTEEIENLKT